jgi:hypothetical protein
MPFNPVTQLQPYRVAAPPSVEGGERLYLRQELSRIQDSLDRLTTAVTEIREHLKTLP